MMRNKTLSLLSLLSILVAGHLAAEAQPSQSVLGSGGQIYEVYAGSFGELFPGNSSRDPEAPVLALDILAPGTAARHLLIPTTGGSVVESAPRLVYDRASDRLNVIWNAVRPNGELRIHLVSYSDGGWGSEVHELYRGGGQISTPQVALTRDTYDLAIGEGQSLSADRSTLHLLWQEQDGDSVTIKYMPVLLVTGSYIGWSEAFDLGVSSAIPQNPEGLDGESVASESSFANPHLSASDRGSGVVVSFADTDSQSLKTFDIGILPLELVYLSDEVQQQVLSLANEFASGEVSSFADTMRIQIIGLGTTYGFHPAVIDYVADQVHAHLLDIGDGYTDLEQLSSDLRDYTIDLTTSLFGTDLSSPEADDGSEIIEIDLSDLPLGDEGNQPAQILDLKMASEVPLPTMTGSDSSIYTSPAGDELIVAWSESDEAGEWLVYVEYTADDGWSEPFSLELGERLDLDRAHQLLAARLR